MPATPAPALFIVSPNHGDELRSCLGAAGYAVRLIRHPHEALRCLKADPAPVVIVDGRGALLVAIDAVRDLADAVDARRGTLLVLLSRGDEAAAGTAYDAGATRALVGPFTAARLLEAVRFCSRLAERLAGAGDGRSSDAAPRRDPLTGLATAAYAQGWAALLLDKAGADVPPPVVLQLALGRFGQFNAAYGSEVADMLLQSVAARLRRVAVAEDAGTRLLARLAGAEFALVLSAADGLPGAERIAAQLAAAFDAPFAVAGRHVHLGCRIGIAAGETMPADAAAAAAQLFQRASAALAVARASPPGTIEVYRDAPGRIALSRMADLEADLRATLESGAFDILFQPQVSLASGMIVGVEALVRWQHAVLGQLSAATLLEVADSAEVALELGAHIQRRALAAAAKWPPALSRLRLAINVTAADVASPGFLGRLDAALDSTGFSPHRLTIELTESDLIENIDAAAGTLAAVRERGMQVALDDFGTGYSSLGYLKALPLDCIKIDKQLTADLTGPQRGRIVVRGIIDMARALGLRVIVEGIEAEAERAAAAVAGCDWYQGFLCAPALTAPELATLIADRAREAG